MKNVAQNVKDKCSSSFVDCVVKKTYSFLYIFNNIFILGQYTKI